MNTYNNNNNNNNKKHIVRVMPDTVADATRLAPLTVGKVIPCEPFKWKIYAYTK